MKNRNNILYGVVSLLAAAACFYGMEEGERISIMGFLTLESTTMGMIFLIFGGCQLGAGLFTGGDVWALIGNILAFPLYVLAWALEHWVVTLLLVGLLAGIYRQKAEEPVEQAVSMERSTFPAMWQTEPVQETIPAWVPPAATAPPVTTAPPRTQYIQQPYEGMHRNAGICKNLTRDAEVLLVFVNDNTSTWTQQEMQNFIGNLVDPGLEYIENQAAKWGYAIDLERCVYPDEAGNIKPMTYGGAVNDYSDEDALNTDLLENAAAAYGFATTKDMIKNVQDYAGTDQVAVVFCLDKQGRSYARWHDTVDDYVEYAVVFTSQNGTKCRAGVFAHELLHLFGADDMYPEGDERKNRAALVQKWHPNELFYKYTWNLSDNVLSSYNAYAVGWLDTMPSQYDCPEWWS